MELILKEWVELDHMICSYKLFCLGSVSDAHWAQSFIQWHQECYIPSFWYMLKMCSKYPQHPLWTLKTKTGINLSKYFIVCFLWVLVQGVYCLLCKGIFLFSCLKATMTVFVSSHLEVLLSAHSRFYKTQHVFMKEMHC